MHLRAFQVGPGLPRGPLTCWQVRSRVTAPSQEARTYHQRVMGSTRVQPHLPPQDPRLPLSSPDLQISHCLHELSFIHSFIHSFMRCPSIHLAGLSTGKKKIVKTERQPSTGSQLSGEARLPWPGPDWPLPPSPARMNVLTLFKGSSCFQDLLHSAPSTWRSPPSSVAPA